MHVVMLEVAISRGFAYLADLADAGVEVSLVVRDIRAYAAAPDFALSGRAARIIEVDSTEDAEQLSGRLRGRLGPRPVDGVFCVTERCMPAAHRLARDLGVPHEALETVALMRDKAAVRARLERAGLGSLRWRAVADVAEGLAAAADIGYPVVVKPLSGYASIGVRVVWSEAAAREALTGVFEPAGGARALVEEYAAGRQVSAELLVRDGRPVLLGFAERLPARPGTTAELGGHFPARFEGYGAARRFAMAVIAALGVRDSPIHLELLVTPTGPELVEINGRIAGHVVTRQMELALGRSLTADLLDLAVGRPVAEVAEPVAVVALRQVWSETGGRVRAADLPADPGDGVAECRLTVRRGDLVRPLRHNYDRIGHVLAVGATAAEAADAAERAKDGIRVVLEPAPGEVPPAPLPPAVPGRHLLLLLGSGGVEPARVLEAIGAVADRVSVLWTGPAQDGRAARACWAARCRGRWYDAPDRRSARQAGALLRAAEPVDGVLTLCPALSDLAGLLAAGGDPEPLLPAPPEHPGAPGPSRDTAAGRAPEPGPAGATAAGGAQDPGAPEDAGGASDRPGHTVVVLYGPAGPEQLGVVRQDGLGADGHRTLRYPAPLADAAAAELRARAGAVLPAAAPGSPLLRVFLPDDGSAASVHPGLDAHTRALLDAVHPRDVVAATARAALGLPPRWPAPRPGRLALLRAPAGPDQPFRVTGGTVPDELYGDPWVASAGAPLPPGSTYRAGGRPTLLWYAVAGDDEAGCRQADRRLAGHLAVRHRPLDRRTHVVLVDRTGGAAWSTDEGLPVLPPDRFRVSVFTGHPTAGAPAAVQPAAPPAAPVAAPVDLLQRIDVFDTAALHRAVEALHAVRPVDRVWCASERLLGPAAALRRRLGVPGDDAGFVTSVRDKAEMKRLAAAAGIPHAAGRVLHDPADAFELLERHGRVVLKPRDLSGSQGVVTCADAAALDGWLRSRFVPGRFLAEEFVPGPMCHIDAVVYADEVLAWDVSTYLRDTLAFTRGRPLSSVTRDEPAVREAARTLLGQVVEGWRVRDGVLHLEAFERAGRLVFCEVAARPGGAGVIRAFEATRGVNLRHAKVLIDAGDDPRRIVREPVAEHAGWTVHYARAGRLAEFDDSAVAALAHHRTVLARPGEEIAASEFSGTGLSTHVFTGDSSAEVRRLVALAEERIRILIEPADAPTAPGHSADASTGRGHPAGAGSGGPGSPAAPSDPPGGPSGSPSGPPRAHLTERSVR